MSSAAKAATSLSDGVRSSCESEGFSAGRCTGVFEGVAGEAVPRVIPEADNGAAAGVAGAAKGADFTSKAATDVAAEGEAVKGGAKGRGATKAVCNGGAVARDEAVVYGAVVEYGERVAYTEAELY